MILIADYTITRTTGEQAIILRELITFPSFVSHDRLFEAIWGDDPDGGPLSAYDIIKLQVCRMRPKLRPGVSVLTRWGFGYRLVVDDIAFMEAA